MDATRFIQATKYVSIGCLTLAVMFFSAVATVVVYDRYVEEPAMAARSVHVANSAHPSAQPVAVQLEETEAEPPKPLTALLDVPVIRQYPELPRGCEVTSLAMLLRHYGIDTDKTELAAEMQMDPTPIAYNKDGSIRSWGDPNTGFVGDITLHSRGFGIYHGGLYPLLKEYVPSAVDLTGRTFEELEEYVGNGVPVLVWTTSTYKAPTHWVTWESPNGPIRTTFQEHAVLLVGYDEQYVYVNDPLSGKKQAKVPKDQFESTWTIMGKQALSYTVNEFK